MSPKRNEKSTKQRAYARKRRTNKELREDGAKTRKMVQGLAASMGSFLTKAVDATVHTTMNLWDSIHERDKSYQVRFQQMNAADNSIQTVLDNNDDDYDDDGDDDDDYGV
jgi:hypothetical protein